MTGIVCIARKTDFCDKWENQHLFLKKEIFTFQCVFFHHGEDILYIPQRGDARSLYN